jgi:hypothetical protein
MYDKVYENEYNELKIDALDEWLQSTRGWNPIRIQNYSKGCVLEEWMEEIGICVEL